MEPEEEEWYARQQQTGAAGRLVVYEAGDRPRDDVLLRGGGTRRIMVASVSEYGKASQAGVKAGDVLVSINGSKDFQGMTADVVHCSLVPPVTLVFMGFIGKLQAEVRLNQKQKICGLSPQYQVLHGRVEAPMQVLEEIVFQQSSATLMLATRPDDHVPLSARSRVVGSLPAAAVSPLSDGRRAPAGDSVEVTCEDEDDDDDEEEDIVDIDSLTRVQPPSAEREQHPEEALAGVYELRGYEARKLVSRALSRAGAAAAAAAAASSSSGQLGERVGPALYAMPGEHLQASASRGTASAPPFLGRDQGKLSALGGGGARDGRCDGNAEAVPGFFGTAHRGKEGCGGVEWCCKPPPPPQIGLGPPCSDSAPPLGRATGRRSRWI